jgi:Homeodomain-like domain
MNSFRVFLGFRTPSRYLLVDGGTAQRAAPRAEAATQGGSDGARVPRASTPRSSSHRVLRGVVRAKILLLAYEHPDWINAAIAQAVGCTDRTVRKWRERNRAGPAVQDAPRPGGPRFFPLSGAGAGNRVGLYPSARFR